MKLFKRIILFFGLVFILLFVFLTTAVFVAANLRIKDIVEREIEQELGIRVTISQVRVSPAFTHIEVEGITAHNPPGFAETELAYINTIHVVIDPLETILLRKPRVYLFGIDIARLNIIRNAQNNINVQQILSDSQREAMSEAQTPFYFNVAVLSLATVHFIDYASGTRRISNYPVNIRQATFFDLKNGNEVVRMIISESFKHTEIGKILHMTIVPVFSQVNTAMSAAWGGNKNQR